MRIVVDVIIPDSGIERHMRGVVVVIVEDRVIARATLDHAVGRAPVVDIIVAAERTQSLSDAEVGVDVIGIFRE